MQKIIVVGITIPGTDKAVRWLQEKGAIVQDVLTVSVVVLPDEMQIVPTDEPCCFHLVTARDSEYVELWVDPDVKYNRVELCTSDDSPADQGIILEGPIRGKSVRALPGPRKKEL